MTTPGIDGDSPTATTFSVATNFDDDLLAGLARYPVAEVFGKVTADIVGGGRASYQVVGIGWSRLERHVTLARKAGIRFNYLLNAACLDNVELTRKGQRAIRALLDRVSELGVGAVTVASPLLLSLVKRNYPNLRVRISVFAGVDHVGKAKQWEDMGADAIVLDSILVNREMTLLKAIRQAVRCELELLVNNNCLQSCAMSPAHMNAIAHASQAGHHTRGFFLDTCYLSCTRARLEDPVNYVRSEWIRPEDLSIYEAMGYHAFKITERSAPTAVLLARAKAYTERRYDGNLLDLVQPFAYQKSLAGDGSPHQGLWWRLRHLFRPDLVDPRRLANLKRLADAQGMLTHLEGNPPVHVDNRALDGFLEGFPKDGCKTRSCDACRYCHHWADRAVRIDPAHRAKTLAIYDEIFDDLGSGRMWGLPVARGFSTPTTRDPRSETHDVV